jgi:cysteine synthase A
MIYKLLDKEGIYLGASSALNVVAAEELAQKLGKGASFPSIITITSPYSEPGKTIVTVLCDGAYRYQTRLFSKQWLKDKNLYNAIPEGLIKYAVLD